MLFTKSNNDNSVFYCKDLKLACNLPLVIRGEIFDNSGPNFGFYQLPVFDFENNNIYNTISSAYTRVRVSLSEYASFINDTFFSYDNVTQNLFLAGPDNSRYIYLDSTINSFHIDINSPALGFAIFIDYFDTILYSELLDNSEQFQLAKSFLNDTDPDKELDPTYWTDAQLKFFDFVEKYNKNVLALRATKKVDANVSGSISQSGQQQEIDLSPLVQQLSNINNKLQTTEVIDNSQKSITDVLNQQANTIQVDEIGLLRSKKGYY